VKLHPVTVMLALLAGGTLLGLWGMLLAVPVVAAAKILLLYAWDTRMTWPPKTTDQAAATPAPPHSSGGDRQGANTATVGTRPSGQGFVRLPGREGARRQTQGDLASLQNPSAHGPRQGHLLKRA
ncbi:MAG: AI-2E family transporter, partial [Actinomycetota bacterium]